MIGTHDEALETQADRDRALRANREASEQLSTVQPTLSHYTPTGWSDAGPVAGLLKDILNEQRKQTELLERLLERKEAAEAPEYPRIP